ncbi:hypothetical protein Tco_1533611 [Tanacetum coccineum]
MTSSDAPLFNSLFVTGKLNEHIQSRGNTICELKEKISRLTKKNNDADPIFDLKALVSQNKDLTAELNSLHDLNEHFRAENAKVKQHYKELYDSIKITCAQTTDQNNSLLSEIENLKAQLKDNSKCVTIPDSKPKVLAPGSCEIANSSICISPRVKFSPHDPIVHHSGHDIKRRVKVNVSSSLVGKVSKYSATGSTVIAPSPSLGPSSWGSSSSRIISMNITSPSSSLKVDKYCNGGFGNQPERFQASNLAFRDLLCDDDSEWIRFVFVGLKVVSSKNELPSAFDMIFELDKMASMRARSSNNAQDSSALRSRSLPSADWSMVRLVTRLT